MEKKPVLVVMAAGMGSRYGGLKQIDPVGSQGEAILDFSLFDAHEAGFETAVIIIKEAIRADFMDTVGKRLEKCPMEIRYAYQEMEKIPAGYAVPEGRVKPWGTSHCLLCAKDEIDGAPFAVINADDYYGKDAYKILVSILGDLKRADDAGMVPYVLGNTMSENGGVTRGVCRIEDGVLQAVNETKNIRFGDDRTILSDAGELSPRLPVSMNVWGFHPDVIPVIEAYFEAFLKSLAPDEARAECLLPVMINDLLSEHRITVRAKESSDCWFGLTYREDVSLTQEALRALHAKGMYPERLF